ncbi:MAG: hypothetical protein AAF604_18020 [Acidobacteriota bacterium]
MKKAAIVLVLGVLVGAGFAIQPFFGAGDPIPFDDPKALSQQFIGWESSIKLTAAQEAIKKEALEALPAPCCSDNTAYTCCCPCNMSLTIWGLSNKLIAEHGYDAEQVREKVKDWITTINPDGFSGRVCYTAGGCMKPFAEGGCGGMVRGRVSWSE